MTYFHVVLGELYSPNKHTGAERDGETLWQKEDQDKGKKNKNTAREGLFFLSKVKRYQREKKILVGLLCCVHCVVNIKDYIYINIVFINRINIFVPPQSFLD